MVVHAAEFVINIENPVFFKYARGRPGLEIRGEDQPVGTAYKVVAASVSFPDDKGAMHRSLLVGVP